MKPHQQVDLKLVVDPLRGKERGPKGLRPHAATNRFDDFDGLLDLGQSLAQPALVALQQRPPIKTLGSQNGASDLLSNFQGLGQGSNSLPGEMKMMICGADLSQRL